MTWYICSELHGALKPRTYRENARKAYLYVAHRRKRTQQLIRKGVGKQLRYVRRNIRILNTLLGGYERCPLKPRKLRYLMVINEQPRPTLGIMNSQSVHWGNNPNP